METTTPTEPATGFTNIDALPNGKLLQVSYGKKRLRKLKMPTSKKKSQK